MERPLGYQRLGLVHDRRSNVEFSVHARRRSFAELLVAIALATISSATPWSRWTPPGKLKWYFQTIHHDLWDQDLPPGPALINIDDNGKKIPALIAIGKAGLMYILNRDTGKPVFGVEERPVAKGDVPGEWYSPTQPLPLKPPPLARNSYKADDIVTAEDTSRARQSVPGNAR